MERHAPRAGFVLAEAAAAAAVLILVGAVLLALASESRRQSILSDDLANLNQFASGTAAYGADFQDAVWNLSWRAGIDYGYGGVATTDLAAQCNQAVEIIRRRTGRLDIGTSPGWIPHVNFVALVLVDYLDAPLPARFIASPADRLRLLWQSDPEDGYYALGPMERPGGSPVGNFEKRMPYSSSYYLAPAFWTRDAASGGDLPVYQTTGGQSNHYQVPNGSLITRRLSEVAFPGQKAMVFDQYQRHFGPREAYFGYAEARVPVLRADGAASVVRTRDSNLGFNPSNPFSATHTRVNYTPELWQPPTLDGLPSQLVSTYYQWTRSGLRGRDFGGPEVPWTE